jgi:hypothetical protein
MSRFFSWDPEGGDFETHDTEEAARDAALSLIDSYLDGDTGWAEEIEDVCWGEIRGRVHLVNQRPLTAEESEAHPHWICMADAELVEEDK